MMMNANSLVLHLKPKIIIHTAQVLKDPFSHARPALLTRVFTPHFVYLKLGLSQMLRHCQLSASLHSRVITTRTNKHW